VVAVPAVATTRFAIDYTPEGRTMTIMARAADLAPAHLPPRFAAATVAYLAPVANEVDPALAGAFGESAVGAGAQGWCRVWDRDGVVRMRPWPDPGPVLSRLQALFLSEDDVAGWESEALALYQQLPLGALTFAARGAVLFVNGERHAVVAEPAIEVDPTGAGDVFAAAFMLHYNLGGEAWRVGRGSGELGGAGGDPWEAAAFAAVAGALAVEGPGIAGVPDAEALAARWGMARRR
jgi:sugar/nucleoside kinase (ribokinase family)